MKLAESVKRDSCPVRRSFVERTSGSTEPTPLVRLMQTQGATGGKGAGLRISLLLSLIWLSSKEPYTTTRVAAYWAALLGRDDPREEGARTIRDCLHELRERGFIMLAARGSNIEIYLSNESKIRDEKTGLPVLYTPPYGGESYLSIPRAFWATGTAGKLSGAGVAMYLVSLAMLRDDFPAFFLTGKFFEERFGISRSSKKRGLAELVNHGVLTVESVVGIDFTTFRRARRNVYTITDAFMPPAPKKAPEEQAVGTASEPNASGPEVVAPRKRRKVTAEE